MLKRYESAYLHAATRALLFDHGVHSQVCEAVARGLVQTSLRGVDSHGLRLLPHYIAAVDAGRINRQPRYHFASSTRLATGLLDADHTFGHAAGTEGMKHAISLARKHGIGLVAVQNSSHFGAAAHFALQAVHANMIGLALTHANSLMHTPGSTRAFFGTNPICFAAPVANSPPFCLDMATSHITWNAVEQRCEEFQYNVDHTTDAMVPVHALPVGTVVDKEARPVTHPVLARWLEPIGDYKGFGLAMVVDLLCSLLTDMQYGSSITTMYPANKQQRRLGHVFAAIDPARFVPLPVFKQRLKDMITQLRSEPRLHENTPIVVPGDPENAAYTDRIVNGIPVPHRLWQQLKELGFMQNSGKDVSP